jgi:hypothetical protein
MGRLDADPAGTRLPGLRISETRIPVRRFIVLAEWGQQLEPQSKRAVYSNAINHDCIRK